MGIANTNWGLEKCEDYGHFATGANISTGSTGAGSGCGLTGSGPGSPAGVQAVCKLAAGMV